VKNVSDKRHQENLERKKAMNYVRLRDRHSCVGGQWTIPGTRTPYLPGECHGPLNGHEIITRAQGGSITDPANIVLLCDFHNEWCTEHTVLAVSYGFRVLRYNPDSPRIPPGLPHLDA
jgi:hypothetical protein